MIAVFTIFLWCICARLTFTTLCGIDPKFSKDNQNKKLDVCIAMLIFWWFFAVIAELDLFLIRKEQEEK